MSCPLARFQDKYTANIRQQVSKKKRPKASEPVARGSGSGGARSGGSEWTVSGFGSV